MHDIVVTKEGVTKLLKGLNPSKALGPDELHPRVLKELAMELGPVFAHLFQQSIDTGEIPKEWSLVNICPLLKKGDRSLEMGLGSSNVSGVPQGTVLSPLLFSLYINDISADTVSEIRFFADESVCYCEIKNEEKTLKLQTDIDRLGSWARKWGMRFHPVKCNMMQLKNKWSNKIQANYTLEGTVLENVIGIK